MMTRTEALRLLQALVDETEEVSYCVCMTEFYPRLTKAIIAGDVPWQPGYRWSDSARAWWDDYHTWEEGGKKGHSPKLPKEPSYVPCEKCNATGRNIGLVGPLHEALAVLRDEPQG